MPAGTGATWPQRSPSIAGGLASPRPELDGGAGDDGLGGAGADTVVAFEGDDIFQDFERGIDRILIGSDTLTSFEQPTIS